MADFVTRLSVKLDDGVTPQAARVQQSLEAIKASSDGVTLAQGNVQNTITSTGSAFDSLTDKINKATDMTSIMADINKKFQDGLASIRSELGGSEQDTQALNDAEQKLADQRDASVQRARKNADAMKSQLGDITTSSDSANTSVSTTTDSIDSFGSSLTGGLPSLTAFAVATQGMGTSASAGDKAISALAGSLKIGLTATLGPLGFAIGSVVETFVNMGAATADADRAIKKLSASLQATREDYKSLALQIDATAKSMALSGPLSSDDAHKAAAIIASSPNFTTGLTDLTKLSANIAAAMDVSIETAAGKVAAAFQDTAAAAKQASDQGIVGFNENLAKSIALLQASGDRAGAFNLYMTTLKGTVDNATAALTPLQQAWRAFTNMFNTDDSPIGRFFANWMDVLELGAARILNHIRDFVKVVDDFFNRFPSLGLGSGTGGLKSQTAAPGFDPTKSLTTVPANTSISDVNQGYINAAAQKISQNFGANLTADQVTAIQNVALFASNVLQVESSGRQTDPLNASKTLTSKAGAMGLMQIMPSIVQDQGGDPNNAQSNVNMGVQQLYNLSKKYDGDLVKVAIAYNWGSANADMFFMGQKQLPAETAAFVTKTTGVTQDQLRVKFADQMSGADFRNATLNDADKVPSVALASQQQANTAQQALLEKSIGLARSDMETALANGDTQGFTTAIQRLTDYQAKLQAAKGAATQLITETAKSADAAAKAAALSGETGTDKAIAAIKQKYDDIAKSSGQPFDQSNFDKEAASKLTELANSYTQATDTIVTQNDREKDLIKTYAGSTQAQEFAKNATLALKDADDKYSEDDPARLEAIEARTKALNDQTKQKNDLAAAGDVKAFTASNELLQTQINLLGASTDAQNQEIAALTERHKWGLTANDDLSEWQQKAVDAAKANAALKTSLDDQKNSLSDLANIFSKSFNSIGDAISSAFVNGKSAAIDFGNVMKAVATQIIKDFLQLAVINPLINAVLNPATPKTTLASALNALGAVSSGSDGSTSGGTSSGGSTLSTLGNLGTIGSGLSTLTGTSVSSLFGEGGSFSGIGSSVSGFLATPLISSSVPSIAGASGAQIAAATAPSGLASESAIAGELGTGQTATAGAGLSVGGALGAVGGIAGGFAAGSLAGSLVAGNRTSGQQNAQIGAGIGAVAGAYFGPVGSLIGGVLGGAIGGLFGPKNASSYANEQVVQTSTGQLAIGTTSSQILDGKAATAALQSQIDSLNATLTANKVEVANPFNPASSRFVDPGNLFEVSTGDKQGFPTVPTLDAGVGQLSFTSKEDSTLADILKDKSFTSVDQFTQLLTSYQTAQTATKNIISGATDLAGSFGKVTGSVTDSLKAVNDQFDQANTTIEQLKASGYLSTQQIADMTTAESNLADVRAKAVGKINDQMQQQIDQTNAGLTGRFLTAQAANDNSPTESINAQLFIFDAQAQQQRDSLKSNMDQLLGDAYLTSQAYADQQANLEKTLAAERLEIQNQFNSQMISAATSTVTSLSAYVSKLKTGSNSPLSPTAQLAAAQSAFGTDTASISAGDFSHLSSLTTDADTLLATSRAVNGSGVSYVSDFNKVISAISSVANLPTDTLTAGIFSAETKSQTDTLSDGLADLKAQLVAIRTELRQSNTTPAQVAA